MTDREALQAIAEGKLPCYVCGEVHAWKEKDPKDWKKGGSWAAEDGHSYFKMDVKEFARQVLERV